MFVVAVLLSAGETFAQVLFGITDDAATCGTGVLYWKLQECVAAALCAAAFARCSELQNLPHDYLSEFWR